jgi:hypothetical protein
VLLPARWVVERLLKLGKGLLRAIPARSYAGSWAAGSQRPLA